MHRIEIVSHSFPNKYSPFDGTFISDHIVALSDTFNISLTVPTPYSIPFTNRFRKNSSKLILQSTLIANRAFYLSFPNKKFPSLITSSISKAILSSIKKSNPDFIHVHFLYPSGLAISEIKKKTGLPVILTIHGVDYYDTRKNKKLRKKLDTQLQAADKIIVVGPKLFEDISHSNPEIKDRLLMIFNYVDTSIFTPPSYEEKTTIKQRLNLSSSSFHLLCVANIRHKKGIDILVESLLKVRVNQKIELHLVGRLNDEPEYRNLVNRFIKNNEISGIHFHGPKPRNEILDWMKASDGFVLPSRNEPFGISLIEAMACGLPVISTKSGGPESILSHEHGQLIEPDDSQELAKAIETMITSKTPNPWVLNDYINSNFGKSNYTKSYTNLYNHFLTKQL